MELPTPVARMEILLANTASALEGNPIDIGFNPVTRLEMYLTKILYALAGIEEDWLWDTFSFEDGIIPYEVTVPVPVTRLEMYLSKILGIIQSKNNG